MRNALQLLDPVQLARIADLQLLVRIVVQGFMLGLHRSPVYGSSIEFAQYRPYAQGDDPRFVDWKLYARTDRLHVKQFQDETNLRCLIALDCSASMDYRSIPVSKFQYAQMLAACLTMILAQQKDAVGLIGYQQSRVVYLPSRHSPNHIRRLLVELANCKAEKTMDFKTAVFDICNLLRPGGMVILITDLLQPLPSILEPIQLLRARHQDVLLFQIGDPAEIDFSFDRSVTLVDSETAREQFVTPDTVREEYLRRRAHHYSSIRETCLASDIEYVELSTNEPLDRALNIILQRRNRFLHLSRRKRNYAAGAGG